MNQPLQRLAAKKVAAGVCFLLTIVSVAFASEFVQKAPYAGGVAPYPTITSVMASNSNFMIHWEGFAGPYQLQQKTNVTDVWHNLGGYTGKSATVPASEGFQIFQVEGPTPRFDGNAICGLCHPGIKADWAPSKHAHALQTLKDIGQAGNAYCQQCHTVGAGLSTGFISEAQTPGLANVQCENCHGSGSTHADEPLTPELKPVKSADAMICGGCHNGYHHPTYDEWLSAKHSVMDDHVAEGFENPDVAAGQARMKSCGSCHSGSVRLAMLKWYETGEDLELPSGEEAVKIVITCAVCHQPHGPTTNPYQLRNPEFSTEAFSYSTSSSTTFTNQYNPEVQVCAQCHNDRGASWSSSSRPPHHSPQYNMLTATVGITNDIPFFSGRHTYIGKQCAQCHTHPEEQETPSPVNPNYKGHQFVPTPNACLDCHSSTITNALWVGTQSYIHQQINLVKGLLDQWALNKAPTIDPAFSAYGKAAWEYTTAGQLSSPDGSVSGPSSSLQNNLVKGLLDQWALNKAPTIDPAFSAYGKAAWEYTTAGQLSSPDGSVSGPSSSLQNKIPNNIKKARFNLYIVEHDSSGGIHNPPYTRYLLQVATDMVMTELGMVSSAK